MSRDLVKFTSEETKFGIVVYENGEVRKPHGLVANVPRTANLKPGDILDFIKVGKKRLLIISDVPIEDASQLVEGAEFVPLDEVEIETGSWSLPLCLPAILARSMKDRDEAWFVLEKIAGKYLEKDAIAEQVRPWQRGWVAAEVRAHWDEWKEKGLVSGESHWGWLRRIYHIDNGGESWENVKGRFEGWMRCADVFLRNTENREWIAGLTLNQILEVPISKANRCCGAISEGLFSHSSELRKALFNSTIRNTDMNHLISVAKAHRDVLPEREVDEETGEITYIEPSTGEPVKDLDVLDEFLPTIEGEEISTATEPPSGVFWVYDFNMKAFCYYKNGEREIGLSVQTDDEIVRRFVEQIIGLPNVHADYDAS